MGWVVNATPRPLYPRERPGTHWIGGWLGLRAGLDWCRKSRLPPEFDPRTVQPIKWYMYVVLYLAYFLSYLQRCYCLSLPARKCSFSRETGFCLQTTGGGFSVYGTSCAVGHGRVGHAFERIGQATV